MIAGFEEAEFARRTETLQALMAEHRLDALLLTGPADIFYVTGFLTQFWESPARPWFVVLPKAGRPIAVIPTIGVPLMGTSWVGEILSWSAPDPVDDGVSLLAETLRAHVPQTGRLGLPMGLETHLRMPLADWSRVQDLIAPRAIVEATPVLHRVREIKSEAEIDRIRHTCAVADAAFAQVPHLVQ
ncbi:MAG: aminopeptidase P family N-terminal domain-containing protein, partial [Pseudomonadota bacterium]